MLWSVAIHIKINNIPKAPTAKNKNASKYFKSLIVKLFLKKLKTKKNRNINEVKNKGVRKLPFAFVD